MWDEEGDDCTDNGLILSGHLLLPELLTSVFAYLPSSHLLSSCSLVCKVWGRIIAGHHLWKMKAKGGGCYIPRQLVALPILPRHVYRTIAVHDPFGKNLIRNCDGKEQMKHWQVVDEAGGWRHGESWRTEDPPAGAQSLSEVDELKDTETTSCFATTYFMCEKYQAVDLLKQGVTQEVIQLLKPKLFVCEWYAARFDCASRYILTVELRDADDQVVGQPFQISLDTAQWAGSAWTKVEHTFDSLENVRYIVFRHAGKDLQFWAGHYGSKMTGATVRLVVD